MKRIVVFYYTQSGQALSVAQNICKPLEDVSNEYGKEFDVVYKEIKSCQKYPFPWTKYEFFDSFPETRLGLTPSGIETIDFSDVQDVELRPLKVVQIPVVRAVAELDHAPVVDRQLLSAVVVLAVFLRQELQELVDVVLP